jgi:hypothetical protein
LVSVNPLSHNIPSLSVSLTPFFWPLHCRTGDQ